MSTPKRRGRPRLVAGQTSNEVNVRLPESLHDALCSAALRQQCSIAAVVRRALMLALRDQGRPTPPAAFS